MFNKALIYIILIDNYTLNNALVNGIFYILYMCQRMKIILTKHTLIETDILFM